MDTTDTTSAPDPVEVALDAMDVALRTVGMKYADVDIRRAYGPDGAPVDGVVVDMTPAAAIRLAAIIYGERRTR